MGYISEVSITMETKDFRRLVKEVEKASEPVQDLFDMAKKFDYDGELVTLYWDYVKWFVGLEELGIEGYEDVMFFENFYRKLKHYKFIRIGEQEDDVELDCAGDYVRCTSVFSTIECGGEEFACNIDNKKPRKVKGEKYE